MHMATTHKIPTIARPMPSAARAFHQPYVPVYALHDSHPDPPSHAWMMSNSHPEVANPHQPRTASSTTRAVNPAEDMLNPATDGMSMCRAAGRGCSTPNAMLVT